MIASISPHRETVHNSCTNRKVSPGQGVQVLKLLVAVLQEKEQSVNGKRMCGRDSRPPSALKAPVC